LRAAPEADEEDLKSTSIELEMMQLKISSHEGSLMYWRLSDSCGIGRSEAWGLERMAKLLENGKDGEPSRWRISAIA